MAEKFVLATHNPGKLAEMKAILSGLGVEVVSPAEAGVEVDMNSIRFNFKYFDNFIPIPLSLLYK